MIPVDEPLFVDTNILIYATEPASPLHTRATDVLQYATDHRVQLIVSPQIFREYLAVASRPPRAGGSTTLNNALENIVAFRARYAVVPDDAMVLDQLVALIHQIPAAGRRIHDANIVATMWVAGIRHLLTHNTGDFARFAHLITVIPLQPNPPTPEMPDRD